MHAHPALHTGPHERFTAHKTGEEFPQKARCLITGRQIDQAALPQHSFQSRGEMVGEDSIYFGQGAHVAGDLNASLSTMLGTRARAGLDVRYQVTIGSWYQVSTMARIDFVPRRDGPRPQRQHALSPTFGDGIVTSQAARPR